MPSISPSVSDPVFITNIKQIKSPPKDYVMGWTARRQLYLAEGFGYFTSIDIINRTEYELDSVGGSLLKSRDAHNQSFGRLCSRSMFVYRPIVLLELFRKRALSSSTRLCLSSKSQSAPEALQWYHRRIEESQSSSSSATSQPDGRQAHRTLTA